jgi:hypothetical protein
LAPSPDAATAIADNIVATTVETGKPEGGVGIAPIVERPGPADSVIREFGQIERMLEEVEDRHAALAGGAVHDAVRATIGQTLDRLGCSVLSFDVFDTLVLRNDMSEAERYWVLSDRIAQLLLGEPPGGPVTEDLYLARNEAMHLCYRFSPTVNGCVEGRIADVLHLVARAAPRLAGQEQRMLDIEIEAEMSWLAPNHALLGAAADAVEAGRRVILVSDMYLDGGSIMRIVEGVCGSRLDGKVELFSSGDLIINKRSGRIFPYLSEKLGVPPTGFLHLGDSLEGDFVQPRLAGWHSMHHPVAARELARREAGLAAFRKRLHDDGLDVAAMAKL